MRFMNSELLQRLKDAAFEIRCRTICEIASFGSGHIGGSMSIVELLSYLYFHEMDVDPADPKKEDRDRLVVSKGHSGPAVYATLAYKGFFPEAVLETLNQGGTMLPSHCDMLKTPGIDFTAGSLGQGFSAALGIATAQKLRGMKARTFTIIGDGEAQEGQIYEAAEAAGAWGTDNLFAFLDKNGRQLDGYVEDIIPSFDTVGRWESFGWDVQEIDGHDFSQIESAIEKAKELLENEEPLSIHGYWLDSLPDAAWWKKRAESGGQLVEQATHIIDIFRYLLGEPLEIYSKGRKGLPSVDFESSAETILTFPGNRIAVLSTSCEKEKGSKIGFTVSLRKGAMDYGWNGKLSVRNSDGTFTAGPDTPTQLYEDELRAFFKAVETGDRSLIKSDYEDAVRTLKVSLLARESMRTGRPMKVPEA